MAVRLLHHQIFQKTKTRRNSFPLSSDIYKSFNENRNENFVWNNRCGVEFVERIRRRKSFID